MHTCLFLLMQVCTLQWEWCKAVLTNKAWVDRGSCAECVGKCMVLLDKVTGKDKGCGAFPVPDPAALHRSLLD